MKRVDLDMPGWFWDNVNAFHESGIIDDDDFWLIKCLYLHRFSLNWCAKEFNMTFEDMIHFENWVAALCSEKNAVNDGRGGFYTCGRDMYYYERYFGESALWTSFRTPCGIRDYHYPHFHRLRANNTELRPACLDLDLSKLPVPIDDVPVVDGNENRITRSEPITRWSFATRAKYPVAYALFSKVMKLRYKYHLSCKQVAAALGVPLSEMCRLEMYAFEWFALRVDYLWIQGDHKTETDTLRLYHVI